MSEDSKKVDWTANSLEREVAHLRQVISTAKLVVTFSAAIAATFVSTAVQTKDVDSCWDEVAVGLMLATLVLTFWVVFLRARPHKHELDSAAFDDVEKQACWAHWLMVVQVLLSVATIIAVLLWLRSDWREYLPWT